jgi:outer membrane protein
MKNTIRITFVILFYTSLTIAAYALNDDVKKLITEASGITDEDAEIAAQKKAVTIFDVYALSAKNTERLAIESENSIQSESRLIQAFGSFLPKVFLRGNKYLPPNNSKYPSSAPRSSISLYARQPIMTGLDELSGFSAASTDIKIKKYTLLNNAAQLLLDISSNFYNIIQIEKSIKNNEETLILYKTMLVELKRRVAIGRSRQSEVQRTNSEAYKLEAAIKALRNDLTHSRLILNILSNIKDNFTLIEGEDLPATNFKPDDIQNIIKNRWEVKAAIETVELAKANVTAAYGGYLPSLYIDGNYALYQEKARNSTSRTRDYYFSLGAEIPLFSGGIVTAKVKEMQSEKRQAELTLSNTLRLAEQDITDAFQSWESTINEVDAFKKALVSAEENYSTIKNDFKLNLVTILDVITSLQSLQGARDDYERTVLQHKFNRIRLGVATNEFTGKNINLLKNR